MNRNDYEKLHGLVCYHRGCSQCKIDHNKPCDRTPEKELINYARELYQKNDPAVLYILQEYKEYKIVFDRYVPVVKYD